MDGLETVRAVQALPIRSTPFVLMVTAHRRHELVKGAELLGIAHVLSKPVKTSLLANIMMQILGVKGPVVERTQSPANDALEMQLGAIRGRASCWWKTTRSANWWLVKCCAAWALK